MGFPIHHGRRRQGQEGTLASSTSSPRMAPLLHQDRASNPHLLSISRICTSPFFEQNSDTIPSWVRQQVEMWSGWCSVQEKMIGNLGHRENDRGQGSIV